MGAFFIRRKPLTADRTYLFEGSQMHYSTLGSGKPVVLVHGSMNAHSWGGFETELSRSHKLYLPHLPGFGASDSVKGQVHNTHLFARSLQAFIEHTGLHEAPVIALSLGSVVAAKAAESGVMRGPLIFIGAPLTIAGDKLGIVSYIPLSVKRIIVSTLLGRRYVLLPALRSVLGSKADPQSDAWLLKEIEATDPKSLVDIDVYRELDSTILRILPRIKNKRVFIYGSLDALRHDAGRKTGEVHIIEGASHNVCSSRPKQLSFLVTGLLRKMG